MKKLLVAAIIFGSAVMFVPSVEAKSAGAAAVSETQIIVQQPGRRWGRQRQRTRTYTRVVRRGYRTYRETYRVTYRPNGRTVTRMISRVRIR